MIGGDPRPRLINRVRYRALGILEFSLVGGILLYLTVAYRMWARSRMDQDGIMMMSKDELNYTSYEGCRR
ncbi:hypothetical protein EX30DRAFT_339650 [Ascodesmis nigricans]|uniref:Uncharacterized protein n=1 Tax=Ascodesmis nigricans TaxID=341454 RepID=A0A4S2N038_9PEZI|nr:hypothetical protein EX30DRAFT_339650 [Ascodesmis nigricans]